VQCENGAADAAALEAQAVAARSYLYYRLATGDGTIGDGQGDQVYTCGREPGAAHEAAVRATSGLVLRYQDTQVAAFYVAGARQEGPNCVGGTDDPTGTEMWVTYNDGKSGDDVTQTPLGFISPSNHANRGCMSQNGGDCLAEEGRDVVGILRFYYGADIGIEQAEGPCVDPIAIDPDGGPGGGGDIDDTGGCTTTGGAGALGLGAAALLFWRRPKRRRRSR
jgi:MYXO-CTERM domain-containing protein